MNEIVGDCNGECPTAAEEQTCGFLEDPALANYTWYFSYKDQTEVSTFDLPFVPGPEFNLDNMTVSLNATHNNSLTQFDVHSLNGLMSTKVAAEIF